jgi:hypothetical protein
MGHCTAIRDYTVYEIRVMSQFIDIMPDEYPDSSMMALHEVKNIEICNESNHSSKCEIQFPDNILHIALYFSR